MLKYELSVVQKIVYLNKGKKFEPILFFRFVFNFRLALIFVQTGQIAFQLADELAL